MQHGTYGFSAGTSTEYGLKWADGDIRWLVGKTRDVAELQAKSTGLTLIAREVSEPRIVSIRA